MPDALAMFATIGALLALAATVSYFIVIPWLKRRHYEATLDKIKRLIKQLPATNAAGQFCLAEDATLALAELQRRHPEWVDRGFTLVRGEILDNLWVAKRSLENILLWREAQRHEIRERHDAVETWQSCHDTHQCANAKFYECISGRKELKQPRASRT